MADDGPPLIRPIPRRPFGLSLTSATPPDEDSTPTTPAPPPELTNARFLQPTPEPVSLSRPQSFLNLTSSTLFGIYSQTATSRDRVYADRDELDTPWGTGAQTPIKRPSVDEATYQLMRDRSHPVRRRSSFRPEVSAPLAASPSVLSLVGRGIVLFVLGIGYGALVSTRFHSGAKNLSSLTEGIIQPNYNWAHLVFWGVSGVVLGGLLPWFDRAWEDYFGNEEDEVVVMDQDGAPAKEEEPSTDWALVMRAIGAFVGIIFAIRKVAWTSTLQVSLTLALANPLLWWLIDRSKPGLLLSAAVGLTGSAVLLGVNPDMMPAPSGTPFGNLTANRTTLGEEAFTLGGLAKQETIESGVWMVSVLFCSCICFGNIGRRLASGRSAASKGRWAGVR